jgi:hypothetical protein
VTLSAAELLNDFDVAALIERKKLNEVLDLSFLGDGQTPDPIERARGATRRSISEQLNNLSDLIDPFSALSPRNGYVNFRIQPLSYE